MFDQFIATLDVHFAHKEKDIHDRVTANGGQAVGLKQLPPRPPQSNKAGAGNKLAPALWFPRRVLAL